jgi:hypothetical protein
MLSRNTSTCAFIFSRYRRSTMLCRTLAESVVRTRVAAVASEAWEVSSGLPVLEFRRVFAGTAGDEVEQEAKLCCWLLLCSIRA